MTISFPLGSIINSKNTTMKLHFKGQIIILMIATITIKSVFVVSLIWSRHTEIHYKVFSLQAEEMRYLVCTTYTGLTTSSQTITSGNQDGET